MDVVDDADDLTLCSYVARRRRRVVRDAEQDALANRIFVREILLHERLRHDDHRRRTVIFLGVGESAAADHVDPHRREEVRRRGLKVGDGALIARRRRTTINVEANAYALWLER